MTAAGRRSGARTRIRDRCGTACMPRPHPCCHAQMRADIAVCCKRRRPPADRSLRTPDLFVPMQAMQGDESRRSRVDVLGTGVPWRRWRARGDRIGRNAQTNTGGAVIGTLDLERPPEQMSALANAKQLPWQRRLRDRRTVVLDVYRCRPCLGGQRHGDPTSAASGCVIERGLQGPK